MTSDVTTNPTPWIHRGGKEPERIVQVVGVEFQNKGAELMLHAVLQEVARWPGIVGASLRVGDWAQRDAVGMHHVAWIGKRGRRPSGGPLMGLAARALPSGLRRRWRVVSEHEVDVALDASGFAHGDQWGPKFTDRLAKQAARWKRHGTTVILLPQAFGPFERPDTREAFQRALPLLDRVYARDSVSYEHLQQFEGHEGRVRLAPDFTNLVSPTLPPRADRLAGRPCLVPNVKMWEKSDDAVREAYVPFMARCYHLLDEHGERPFILIHSTNGDGPLADLVSEAVGGAQVVTEPDPLHVKGIIGQSQALVASRFHGLANGLSQAVPTLGTGWSHKYRMLFRDYDCPDALLDVLADETLTRRKIAALFQEPDRTQTIETLQEAGGRLKAEVREMWADVRAFVDVDPC